MSAAARLKLYADAQPPGSAIVLCGGGPMLLMSDLLEVLAQLNRVPATAVARPDLSKLTKWSYSQTMGVMVPNSPQPRRKFYAVEDVEALFAHQSRPVTTLLRKELS